MNISAVILGPEAPYTFQYQIDDPKSLLQPNTSFTEFNLRIYDIEANILGGGAETIKIKFKDLSVIQDLSNNTMAESTIIQNLNRVLYVTEEQKQGASSTGMGMKYTIISFFSMNFLIKMAVSSSAAMMWSLIHVLQAFRYILMMNITMPQLVDLMMGYLAVVVGEVEEIDSAIPDVYNSYIVDTSLLTKDMKLYPRFEENGYEYGILTLQFSRQAQMGIFFWLVTVPLTYLGVRYLKKIPSLHKKWVDSWQELFWNTPLRAYTEVYIELCLLVFLNTLNVQFDTVTGITATIVMFIAGLFALFWPFVLLSKASFNPKYIKRPVFQDKFGMLTEGIYTSRTLYQKSYYPLYVFHRLLLTAILVLLYEYPKIQIELFFIIQIAMISYIIWYRPFKSELQQVIVATDEFTIFFGLVVLYYLYLNQMHPVRSFNAGLAIMGIVCWSLVKNISIILYISIKKAYIKFRTWIHKKTDNAKRMKIRLRKERSELEKKQAEKKRIENIVKYGTDTAPSTLQPSQKQLPRPLRRLHPHRLSAQTRSKSMPMHNLKPTPAPKSRFHPSHSSTNPRAKSQFHPSKSDHNTNAQNVNSHQSMMNMWANNPPESQTSGQYLDPKDIISKKRQLYRRKHKSAEVILDTIAEVDEDN